jgi:hypothetical protein
VVENLLSAFSLRYWLRLKKELSIEYTTSTARMPWTSVWILWQPVIRCGVASINIRWMFQTVLFLYFSVLDLRLQMIAFQCYPCASMWHWPEFEQVPVIHALDSDIIKHPVPTHSFVSSQASFRKLKYLMCVKIRNGFCGSYYYTSKSDEGSLTESVNSRFKRTFYTKAILICSMLKCLFCLTLI